MTNIAVISDTHHDKTNLEKIIPILQCCDTVIHLGDGVNDIAPFYNDIKNFVAVKGNCDIDSTLPPFYLMTIGKFNCLFLHGDKFNVTDSPLNLYFFAKQHNASYVFYGHTHIFNEQEFNGVHLINVGSLSKPRDGYPSYILIHPHTNKLNISYMKLQN